MKHWRFGTNRISSVATAQPQSQKPVFFTLTWPGDLTFGDLGLKFLHKVCNSILSRYWKNGGAARRRFFRYPRKNRRGGHFLPPSSARANKSLSPLYPVAQYLPRAILNQIYTIYIAYSTIFWLLRHYLRRTHNHTGQDKTRDTTKQSGQSDHRSTLQNIFR